MELTVGDNDPNSLARNSSESDVRASDICSVENGTHHGLVRFVLDLIEFLESSNPRFEPMR